jgi:hypothetical protein
LSSIAIALVVLACVLGGGVLGLCVSRTLPAHHLGADSRDSVKMAIAVLSTLAQTRWLTVLRAAGSTIPTAFLVVLVSWLTIVFAGIGILAPRNATVILGLVVCAISVSAAVFLILELDTSYGGRNQHLRRPAAFRSRATGAVAPARSTRILPQPPL